MRRYLLVSITLSAQATVMATVRKDEEREIYWRYVRSSGGVDRRIMDWMMDWGMASVVTSVIRVRRSMYSLLNFWPLNGLESTASLYPSIKGFNPIKPNNATHKGCPKARLMPP